MENDESKFILGVVMTLLYFGGVAVLMKSLEEFGIIGGVLSFALGIAAFYIFSEVVN